MSCGFVPAVSAPAAARPVTIITQTRVLPDRNDDFAAWQQRISDVVAGFPGFIDHQVIPPDPPQQVDWVILQKFATGEQAQAWLRSKERLRLLENAQPMLVGRDDVHIIEGDEAAKPADEVSAVISMEIKPGQEEAYRVWNQRITAAETQYPGFQGHRLNPPIPGVQDDWVTILTFDTEAHLDAWLNSPERQKLLDEATAFSEGVHARKVRTGFDQWFRVAGAAHAPAWKQNMLVLLALYPVVFLFGYFVQTPLLMRRLGWPFWLALFVGNIASVVILNWWCRGSVVASTGGAAGRQRDAAAHSTRARHRGGAVRPAPARFLAVPARILDRMPVTGHSAPVGALLV